MLTHVLWWSGDALLALVLIFAVKGRFFTKYLIFYLYMSLLLAVELSRLYIFIFKPGDYLIFYWFTEFLIVAGSYGVMWEIYKEVLKDYGGTAKLARWLVSTIFLAVVGKVFINILTGEAVDLTRSVIELERNMRAVQAALMIVILALVMYYGIPLGRNLRGLMLGYGFFIGTSITILTLRSYLGTSFQSLWQYLDQACSLVALLIWCTTLWSYQPNPEPEVQIQIEGDYILLAERTSGAIAKARGYIARVFIS